MFIARVSKSLFVKRVAVPAAALTVLALLAGVPLNGCSSNGAYSTVESSGPEAFKPLAGELAKVGYGWDWSGFPKPAGRNKIEYISAYSDVVVTQDSAGKLTALEPGNGRVRWSNELTNRITKFVGLVRDTDPGRGDRIVSSSEAEAFVVDVRSGDVTSRQAFQKVVNTRPVLDGPIAIYGTPDGELMGHLLTRNIRLWGFDAPGSIEFAPVHVGGLVGGITQDGYAAFVDPRDGSLLGRAKVFGGVATEPVSDDNLMFVASLDQSLYAISPLGKIVWRHRTSQPLTNQPTVVGGTVYCATADDGFAAFNAANGQIRWSTNEVHGTVIGTRKGRLVVWDGRTLVLLDQQRGQVVERADLPGVSKLAFDSFDNGNLYAVSSGGVVGKFLPK